MIQIINGFKINAKNPIDSRIIVADDATRLAIQYKYHGLRVWQTNTNTPYFWDGTAWKSELDLVVTGDGNVTAGYVPYFSYSDPVKIGDSIISVTSSRVVIDGDLSFDSITSGSIDASFIDTGNMSVIRLQKGNPGQVLQTVGTDVKWRNLSDLTIGTSTNSTNSEKVKIKPVSGVDTDYRLVLRLNSGAIGDNSELFSDSGTGGLILRYSTISGLRILAHNGSSANPPYSFDSSSNTGMYRIDGVNSGIGFSVNGNQRVIINNFGLKTILGSVGSPSYTWYGDSTTGMYSPGTNQIGFSIAGQQAVKITSSSIDFGDVDYSPRIRTGDNTSPTSPSFTWRGNNETGIYRPSQDVIGFSIAGNLMGFFESDGLRIKDKNGSSTGYINVSYIGVPIGGIIMWSGDINDIGNGHLWNFRLCDGQTIPSSIFNPDGGTNLTPKYSGQNVPDLRERFVVGAGGTNGTYIGTGYSIGNTGGSNSVTLDPEQVPLRNHAHGPGDLEITSSGGHTHLIPSNDGQGNGGILRDGKSANNGGVASGGSTHTHPIGSFIGNTEYVGIETGIGSHENRPPYYAVAFIIRIV